MANNKLSYASLKLKIQEETKTVDFLNSKIEVKQYLPISDKNDLIMITLQKSYEGGIYNPLKIDMYFHLHLIYLYTNISFTEKQKEDEAKLYDTLVTNGILTKVLEVINPSEYEELQNFLEEAIAEMSRYNQSAKGIITKIIDDLPIQAQAAMDIVNNFDKNKFAEVVNFAQAANGGRAIE